MQSWTLQMETVYANVPCWEVVVYADKVVLETGYISNTAKLYRNMGKKTIRRRKFLFWRGPEEEVTEWLLIGCHPGCLGFHKNSWKS